MNDATQARGSGTLPGVTYKLEFKGADWPDPAVPEGALADPGAAAPADVKDPHAPQWAGDLYEEGDESDPVEAFAAFTGEEGQTAWLDVSGDGTITGWVKDGEQVYRYTDTAAWEADVDGAAMERAGELDTGDDGLEDPDLDGDPEGDVDDDGDGDGDGEQAPDADAQVEDEQDVQVDDSEGHDPNGDTPAVPGDGVAPESSAPEGAATEDEGMDPADDNFYTRMKKNGEKKSLAIKVSHVR